MKNILHTIADMLKTIIVYTCKLILLFFILMGALAILLGWNLIAFLFC